MTDQPVHTLTVTRDEAGVAVYRLDCPGLTEECEAWVECHDDACDWDALDRATDARRGIEEPVLHGVAHRRIDGWMVPTGQCWPATDSYMVDAAREMNDGTIELDGGEVPAGTYRVRAEQDATHDHLRLYTVEQDADVRARCAVCGGTLRLVDGLIEAHTNPDPFAAGRCAGSGQKPRRSTESDA